MKNNIAILGCGWLGEPLAYHFVDKGYTVNGSSRNHEKLERLRSKGVEPHFVNCDLELKLSPFFCVDILVICLTNKDVTLAKHLISLIESSQVKKVVFVSSTSVYKAEGKIVSEDSPLVESPLVAIEELFRASEVFETTIVRFAGLVGETRHPGRFFAKGNILKTPNAPVNLIHLEDCIQLINAIVLQEKWGEVYNGCSSTHPIKSVFYTQAAHNGGYPLPVLGENVESLDKVISNKKVVEDLLIQFIHPDLLTYYS